MFFCTRVLRMWKIDNTGSRYRCHSTSRTNSWAWNFEHRTNAVATQLSASECLVCWVGDRSQWVAAVVYLTINCRLLNLYLNFLDAARSWSLKLISPRRFWTQFHLHVCNHKPIPLSLPVPGLRTVQEDALSKVYTLVWIEGFQAAIV